MVVALWEECTPNVVVVGCWFRFWAPVCKVVGADSIKELSNEVFMSRTLMDNIFEELSGIKSTVAVLSSRMEDLRVQMVKMNGSVASLQEWRLSQYGWRELHDKRVQEVETQVAQDRDYINVQRGGLSVVQLTIRVIWALVGFALGLIGVLVANRWIR